MARRIGPRVRLPNRLALLVSALGLLVAVLPIVYLPSSSGGVGFAVLVMKGIGVAVGLAVVGVGLYSYRTGNLRPAVATGSTVVGLVVVGAIGGFVETTGGPLIPIWVWFLSAVLVIGVAFGATYRFVDEPN